MSRRHPASTPPSPPQKETGPLGGKIRALRRRNHLSQSQLAEKLGVSAAYLNLIENNRRPLPAALLIKLVQMFDLDLHAFAVDEDARLAADLMEAFSDPVFDDSQVTQADVREFASSHPAAARGVLLLFQRYRAMQQTNEQLTARLTDGDDTTTVGRSHLPSEEVSDFVQRHTNYFGDLEDGADHVLKDADFRAEDPYGSLVRYLEDRLQIRVQVAKWGIDVGTLRRFDPDKRVVTLSELLPTRSRMFQLAHQIGLVTQKATLESLAQDPLLTSDESRALAHVALANYFAGAVLMPYQAFLQAARETRYDVDVLGRRFRMGFEQVCHRLTTLRRAGAEGIPFHMIRIDVAGNISKRFSSSGIRFARFSGACPRWNMFSAFQTPGMIRVQVSQMPDGVTYFCIARTIQKESGGYHAQHPVQAIGLGCRIEHARELVYSDGIDLESNDTCVPVGITCRLCERTNCEQRALPSLKVPLAVDENRRGVTMYTSGRNESGAPLRST